MSSTNKTNYSYTKKEIDSMGGGASLSDTISQKADKSDLNNYLPLTGGRMSGAITNNNTTGLLRIFGGTSASTGANLDLDGADYTSTHGGFHLRARNTQGYAVLDGKPDGTLTWDGKQLAYAYNNTVTLTNIHVGGTLTSSGKGVHFAVPINVHGTPSITLSRLRIRCKGNYLFGSSGSTELPTQSYSISTATYYGCVNFNLTFTNADGVNNEAVALEVSVKLTY